MGLSSVLTGCSHQGATRGGRRVCLSRLTLIALAAPWVVLMIGVMAGHADEVRLRRIDGLAGEKEAATNPVYVEDSPAAGDLLRRADQLRVDGRLVDAARHFQRVVEEHPFKLVSDENGGYCDAAWLVRRRLAADAALLAKHRRLFESAAEGVLQTVAKSDGSADVEVLAETARRFPLCRAGLEAVLLLAAWHLERAEPGRADALLDDVVAHPDHGEVQTRWHLLKAAAALFADRRDTMVTHRAALEQLAAGDEVQRLRGWEEALQRPPLDPTLTSMRQSTLAGVAAPSEAPLWRVGVPTPYPATAPRGRTQRQIAQAAAGVNPYMMPVARRDRIYVNDGMSVMAMDRDAGEMALWQYTMPWTRQQRQRSQRTAQTQRAGPELRSVALAGDIVLAVLGQVPPIPITQAGMPWRTMLVALDAHDGSVKWRLAPDQIGEPVAEAFLHGTPVVVDQQVYVLLRRTQRSRFHDAYMASIDVNTGHPRWVRHLASAMPPNQLFVETRAQVTADGGRLYVVENLGIVACLEARSGMVRWARIIERRIKGRTVARPTGQSAAWQVTAPFRVAAGLVAHLGDQALILDPDTGQLRRSIAADKVRQAHYLARAGDDLLAVGPTVARLDGNTFDVLWRTPLQVGEVPLRPIAAQGRGTVTADTLVLPVADHLVEISLADGEVRTRHAVEVVGNTLAVEHGIIVAGPREVCGYFDWQGVSQRMRHKVAQRPTDPMPSVALAHLALASERFDVMLASIDAALAALARRHRDLSKDGTLAAPDDPLREVVFDQLMRFVDGQRVVDSEVRRAVFLRLAAVTSTPEAAVRFRMAHGDFLAETARYPEAMDQYQSVLDDPVLATSTYRTKSGAVQAGLESQIRQEMLIASQNRATYVGINQRAFLALEKVALTGGPSAQRYLEVARRYPISVAAEQAVVAAAKVLAADGNTYGALGHLRRWYAQVQHPAAVRELVSLLAELSIRDERANEARRWLLRAQRDHGPLSLLRGGQTVAIADWIESLEVSGAAPGYLPAFEVPLQGIRTMPGRLMTPAAAPRLLWPRDRILLALKQRLVLRHGPDLAVAWDTVLDDDQGVTLLALDAQQVILWLSADKALLVLDGQSGNLQWRLPVTTLMRSIEAAGARRDAVVAPNQVGPVRVNLREGGLRLDGQMGRMLVVQDGELRFDGNHLDFAAGRVAVQPGLKVSRGGQMRSVSTYALMIAVGDSVIVLADGAGNVTGVDRVSGKTLWHRRCDVHQVTHLVLDEPTVAVAGTVQHEEGQVGSRIQVFTITTGEPRVATIGVERPVRWLAVRGAEALWYMASGTVTAFSLSEGVPRWELDSPHGAPPVGGWLHGDVLQMELPGRRLLALDARTKRPLGEPIQLAGVRDAEGFDIRHVEGTWHVMERSSLLALSMANKLVWKDAVSELNKQFVTQMIGSRYLIAVHQVEPPLGRARVMRFGANRVGLAQPNADRGQRWKYHIYFFDREHGLLLHEESLQLDPPLTAPLQPRASMVLDNRIVLAGEEHAVVLFGGGEN